MRTKMNLFYAVLLCFFNFGYFCSLLMASPSDHLQESRPNRELSWNLSRHARAELSLAQQIKYGNGVGGRGRGGGYTGGSVGGGYAGGASGSASSKGNGGGSSSSDRQQGVGVIPVYAAGASNNHRNNHNGGNSLRSYQLFSAILWAVLELVITNAFSFCN